MQADVYLGLEMIREIRQTCFIASSNKTRSMTAFVSLYSFRACKMQILSRHGLHGLVWFDCIAVKDRMPFWSGLSVNAFTVAEQEYISLDEPAWCYWNVSTYLH